MADNAAKYGFRFYRALSGAASPKMHRYRVASAYNGQPDGATSVDINIGDVVKLVDAGTVQLAAAGDTALLGVVGGIGPYYNGTKMTYGSKLPNATTYGSVLARQSFVYVIPFNGNLFEVDCDDSSSATTEAAYYALIGSNGDLSVSCSSTTLKANYRLDVSDLVANDASPASAQFRMVDISPTPLNMDFSGNYVKVLVVANEGILPNYNSTGL